MKPPEINRLPAARGVAWVSGAMRLIRRRPARLMLLGLILQFLMGFSQVGVLALLLILAIPAFTAGMMQAMRAVDYGTQPPLAALFSAFYSGGRLGRLVALGSIMLGGGMLAVMLVLSGSLASMDPAILARLEAGDINALESVDPRLIQRLMLAMLAGLLVSGSISYFAVPLVWFKNYPLGRAIKTGLLGMIRNWLPFLVLGLLMGMLAIPVVLLTAIVFAASASESVASPLFTVIALLVVVAFQLVLFGAQYYSFKEVFGMDRPGVGETGGQDGQLVA